MPIRTSFDNPEALRDALANFDFGEALTPEEFAQRIREARERCIPLTRQQTQAALRNALYERARDLGIDPKDLL